MSYKAMDPTTAAYLQKFQDSLTHFKKVELKLWPREDNSQADALANITSAFHSAEKRTILVKFLAERSILAPSVFPW